MSKGKTQPKPKSGAVAKPTHSAKRVGEIFQDSQKSASYFRKCRVALRKVQEDLVAAGEVQEFDELVIRALNRTLTHKRREPEIDRVINFLATFLKYASELDRKVQVKGRGRGEDELPPPTPTTDLAEKIVTFYAQGLKAADKVIRARVCQIMANTMVFLGPIEEELYSNLRKGLYERLNDKESNIRVFAAQALAPLQGDDTVKHPDKLVDKLLDALQSDPSQEVRRNILKGVIQNARTLPSILNRCRDIDAQIRKEVFQKNMFEYRGFLEMSIFQREQILRCGLSDRDEAVSKACLDMLSEVWLPQIDGNLIELLEKLDVMNNDVAELALKSYLKAHPDFWKGFTFPDQFWENLSIESAFLARVLITFVQAEEDLEKLDELLPSASTMAQLIKAQSNVTANCFDEDQRIDEDFKLVQLLEITLLHDFADEAGRRKVFDILRKLFVKIDANCEQIKVMVSIIRKLSNDELDFTRTVVEIQSDILEEVNSDFQAVSFQDIEYDLEIEEKKDQHRDFLNAAYKCLITSKHMLRLCEMTIEKNAMLSGVLNDLIYPASKCNIDVLNAAGSECLGLCCMLDKQLAANNFQHFTYLIKDEDMEVQLSSLKVVLDLCAIYGVSSFTTSTAKIYEFFKICMKASDKEFLATAAQGIAKLFLAGTLDDPEILGRLIQLYFIPATADNAKLRQGLHYFLEAYAYFSPNNRFVIAKAFTPSLTRLVAVHKKFGAKFPMLTPFQIGLQLADWTNPHKSTAEPSDNLHTSIAIELLKEAFAADESNPLKVLNSCLANCKLIFQILPKLAIDTFTSPAKLLCLSKLLHGFKEKCQYPDTGSRNAATKFNASILKQMKEHCPEAEPEPLDPEVVEIDEFLLGLEQSPSTKRANSKPSAPAKRRKVKREVSETSDEDASYAP